MSMRGRRASSVPSCALLRSPSMEVVASVRGETGSGSSSPSRSPFASDTWGWPPEHSGVSHDFWVALLSSAFEQRSYVADILIDHRLHDRNASGWIPSSRSREFTRPGDDASDIGVMIDVVVKRGRVRRWTRAFLGVVAERGADLDPAASKRLQRSLRQNRRRHLPPERA